MLMRGSRKLLSICGTVTEADSPVLWSICPPGPFKIFGLGGSKFWPHLAFLFKLWHKWWKGTPIPCNHFRVIAIHIMPDSDIIDGLNHTDSHWRQSSTSCRNGTLWKDGLLRDALPPKEEGEAFFPFSNYHISQQLFGFVLCLDII